MKRWSILNPMSKRILLILFWINLLLTGLAFGTDRLVPETYTTIQAAIDAAVDGDTVIVSPGQYSPVSIYKNITVRSINPEDWETVQNTWIHGGYWHTGAYIGSDATLKGFRFTSCGTDYYGGAICIIGCSPTISNCLIQYNGTEGIRCQYSGQPVITNCKILNNPGGIVVDGSYPTVKNCVIVDCGPAVLVQYSTYYGATFQNCTIVGGGSYMSGRIEANDSSMTFFNTIFDSVTFYDGGNVNWYFSHCCNSSAIPGVDGNINADPDFVDSANQDYHLEGNSPCVDAGAGTEAGNYDLDGEPRINGNLIDMGADEFVARVHNTNPLRNEWYHSIRAAIHDSQLDDVLVINPGTYHEQIQMPTYDIVLQSTNPDDWAVVEATVIDAGQTGRVVTFSGTETDDCHLEGFTITGGLNTVPATNGAGIMGNGTGATIRRCIIRDNAANYGCGPGLFTVNGLIEDCKIFNNHASMHGGAISGSNGTFRNCLITDNTAGQNGGAINNSGGTIVNCTIANNHADGTGGGFRWLDASYRPTITNCIIWGNTDDDAINTTTTLAEQIYDAGYPRTVTYCCVQSTTTAYPGSGNILNDPLFVDANGADNTYGTIDDNYQLGFSSPCVDTGTDIGVDLDIDGEERLTNHRSGVGKFDMGAYECRIFESGQKTPEDWTYDYVYYGHLHNHCKISDGTGSVEDAYSEAKEESKGLDFFGLADHGYRMKLYPGAFAMMKASADTNNQRRVFTTFRGFEWTHSTKYGHIAVIKAPDDVALEYCNKDNPSTFAGLMAWLDARDCVGFFNHPGRNDGSGQEFEHFTGAFSDKIVGMELWNKNDLFNTFYYNTGYTTDGRTRSGYYDEALFNGWRIGAAGSEDNHDATWGEYPRAVAIPANVNTREELYAALQARRFYSTLDKNLMLSFEIDGHPMGSQIAGGPSTCVVKAADGGSEIFTKVELIVNGNIFDTEFPNQANPVLTWELDTHEGDYIYCKVTQADGNEAISSPIFVISDGPLAQLTVPEDNGGADLDRNEGEVTVQVAQAAFTLLVSDPDGVDSDTVDSGDIDLYLNDATEPLVEGTDYEFDYEVVGDDVIITLAAPAETVFDAGLYRIVVNGISDTTVPANAMTEVSLTVLISVKPLKVSLVSPGHGQTVSAPSVTFTATGTDDIGLASAELFIADAPEILTVSGPTKIEDAYCRKDNPDTNYDSQDQLVILVDGQKDINTPPPYAHAVMKFPGLIGSGAGQIPSGAEILSASLEVNCSNQGDMLYIFQLTQGWSETQVTWNNAATGIPWNDRDTDFHGAHAIVGYGLDCSSTGWRSVDLKEFVQEWSNGAANLGIIFFNSGDDGVQFRSSEHTNSPKLTIEYRTWTSKATQTLSGEKSAEITFPGISVDEGEHYWNVVFTNMEDAESRAPDAYRLIVDGQ